MASPLSLIKRVKTDTPAGQIGLAKRLLQRYNTQNNSCEKRFLTGTAIAAASGEGPFYVDRLGSLFTEIQKGHPHALGVPFLFCSTSAIYSGVHTAGSFTGFTLC